VTETSTGISVRQARFIDTGAGAVEDDTLWEVPIDLYTADGSVKQDLVLTTREMEIPLDTSKAYKLNVSGTNLGMCPQPAAYTT
jgi:aminopeptidase N